LFLDHKFHGFFDEFHIHIFEKSFTIFIA
jgi:hypothetical protein